MRSSEFKNLVFPFNSRLFRLAYSLLNNKEEAEDLVQEVYLKLWKMKKELKKYSSVEALAVKMTRNMCLDQLRRRKTSLAVMENEKRNTSSIQNDPDSSYEQEEKRQIMYKLISQLPEPQRSLVHFRHVEGKEYREIEELMNMKENAIRVSISRARKQLKEMLHKQYASWTD